MCLLFQRGIVILFIFFINIISAVTILKCFPFSGTDFLIYLFFCLLFQKTGRSVQEEVETSYDAVAGIT